MAEATPTPDSVSPLETLQKASSKSRRVRPPEMDPSAVGDENRVPLRADKVGRRESRLGLRGLFTRNKASTQNVRASITDLSNWPYSFNATRSDTSLLADQLQQQEAGQASRTPSIDAVSQARQPPQSRAKQPTVSPLAPASSTPKSKKTSAQGLSPPSRPVRGSLAAWDPPPLFQAYPQAIKHARLPACAASIETLMRLQNSRSGGTNNSATSMREPSLPDSVDDDSAADKASGKAKKRHRRNTSASTMKLDWSSKIYVFVTSGYLLQYAGEGSFDRLPEKMLHIGKDSAAFASDLIPGRHWVLQVCSAMDSAAPLTYDSRSLFSRLPFRSGERRHASGLLMVYESAEDMESWLSTFRREIEHLGGKKHLSETGNPKAHDRILQLKGQPSQRTLVVRDPERFSRVITTQDVAPSPWRSDTTLGTESPMPDIQLETTIVPSALRELDPSADDMSVTNSLLSQDGRQLESLRESANRLSFISSGQRTVVTSECSSPPCSPVCDSFTSSNADETSSALTDSPKEVWPSSSTVFSAAGTTDCRHSIQPTAAHDPLLDFRFPMPARSPKPPTHLAHPAPPPLRSHTVVFCNGNVPVSQSRSALAPVQSQHGSDLRVSTITPQLMPSPAIPNFSVPHKTAKRSSVATRTPKAGPTPATSPAELPTPPQQLPGPRLGTRRPPTSSLAFSRPLSAVTDEPSPQSKSPALSLDTTYAPDDTNPVSPCGSNVLDTSSLLVPLEMPASAKQDTPLQASAKVGILSDSGTGSNLLAAESVEASPGPAKSKTSAPTSAVMVARAITYSRDLLKEGPRPSSAMDSYRRQRSQSPAAGNDTKLTYYKRVSMLAQTGGVVSRPMESLPAKQPLSEKPDKVVGIGSAASSTSDRFCEGREQGPRSSASNAHLRAHSAPQKALFNRRRSMSQLAEGPPPAPPPTCALPPLPPSFYSLRGRGG